ncbi:MAG: glucosyl-3-phosphoglycerate synthase [Actinomycetota bacterium]|nr:glucosyl-3-phosphoglycerate synthase [Actinomycetota bacterium]
MALSAVVVIPARDEEARIGACLAALAAQTVRLGAFETIVVLDACTDATAAVAERTALALGLPLRLIEGPGEGSGAARRIGMDLAAERLLECGRPDGLIASTDADTQPAQTWLERQLDHVGMGAEVIAGIVELDPEEAMALPAGALRRRERDAAERLQRVRELEPCAEHHHFAGASLGVTAAAYRSVGGLEPVMALEDVAFATRLGEHGISILRPANVRVRTSARRAGRARRGLSVDLEISSWLERRRYDAANFSLARLRELKGSTSIAVVIPTKECGPTIAAVLECTVAPLVRSALIDEIVVVDAHSADGTDELARRAGARVVQQDEVLPDFGPALGKGDAMWRSLAVTDADVVCFLDGDTADPNPLHLQGLIGPLLADPTLQLVKGAFERPLSAGGFELANEGGRVTELMARPLLNLYEPLLSGFVQPLAGEFAARRGLLESIPFPAGYGVEIAVLIDALRRHGLDALAESHLGVRHNRHQPLRSLGEMAYAVLAAVERRTGAGRAIIGGHYLRPWEENTVVQVIVQERPPLATDPQQRA